MYKIIGADQKEYGPVSTEQMSQWITEGRVNAQTLIQAEGTEGWQPLSAFPEFASVAPAQPRPAPAQPQEKIPNYLVQSILCTLCCCLPGGVVAIIYAAQVNAKQSSGDYDGALAASKNAKMWCWISFGVGLPVQLIGILLAIMGGGAGGNY
jgi:hypothetical protein